MTRFLPDAASPAFSVVINTLNRADLLDDAIAGVMQLDYPAFELVVVNGPSTDHSEEVLARWQGRIKHLRCDVANLSVSRNVGIAAAAGEIVAFLDDDAVPHPHWLRYLARRYADPAVGGAGGFTVDNTGQRWQVRKTVCDRFGNAHFPPDSFDETVLNWPGTPVYPSLLGTNSSFRMEALRQIGGFDHTFAYLLDETDVCLRLVDAGWGVVYEPAALIFHQFAASHIRTNTRKAKTLYPSVVSKTYFINHHGRAEGYGKVAHALQDYRDELLRANAWLEEHGEISPHHRQALDSDVEAGTEAGMEASSRARLARKTTGDLAEHAGISPGAFLATVHPRPLRVALVSQGLPPDNEAGIARWTMLLAEGLREEGVAVHVITRARDLPSRRFANGIWIHRIAAAPEDADTLAATWRVPRAGVADWMAGVMREIAFLKTFGLDLVSFPIWDLEALPVLDDPEVKAVLSLHTSYKLARPFKPEWTSRVIYGRSFVEPMIAAETAALARAPHILANSRAVIDQIEQEYAVSLGERARIVPHGTPDILERLGESLADKQARQRRGGVLRVLFAGRFEARKGHDLALKVAAHFRGDPRIRFEFVGASPDTALVARMRDKFGLDPGQGLVFHGEVERGALEALYHAADVVLMPSRFESFGLVAIEAMSAATPVLALAVGGLAEVVEDGVSGFLFADEEAYVAGSAERLAALIGDRVTLSALAESSHAAFLARFSDRVMAREVAGFYRAIMAGEGGEDE